MSVYLWTPYASGRISTAIFAWCSVCQSLGFHTGFRGQNELVTELQPTLYSTGFDNHANV